VVDGVRAGGRCPPEASSHARPRVRPWTTLGPAPLEVLSP
jgi:hypothetical protein